MQWWRRREVWLGALSVVLVWVLYNQLSAWLVPSLPPDLLSAVGGAPGRGAMPPDAVPEVRIDALASQRSPYDPRGRNLFQYGHRQPPPPPPPTPAEIEQADLRRRQEEEEQRRKVEEILRQRREDEARRLAAQQQPPPEGPAAPPPAAAAGPLPPAPDYKFVGYMGKAADKIAVLLQEGEVVLVKEGEKLGKDFVVRDIRFESVELGYTDPRFKDHKQLIPMGN